MRILFAGGGTAGHINPAIAIAKFVLGRRKESEIAFVGTKEGLEATLIPKEGFPIYYIDVRGFKRKLSFYNVGAARRAVSSLFEAKEVIERFRPDVVIGTGGYVSFPVLYMAAKRKIPTLIHEQNVTPGVTSKMLSKNVDRVLVSFEESRTHFNDKKKVFVVGNPVREEIVFSDQAAAKAELGLDERPFVLSFAGSLGAREINKMILDFLPLAAMDGSFQFNHATGDRGYKWMPSSILERGIDLKTSPHIKVEPYIFNMPKRMAAADIIIARAGAITLSEIAIMNKASILIPSPNVSGNHQYYNALAFKKAGAAILVEEKNLKAEDIFEKVKEILANKEEKDKMERAAGNLAIYDSTQKIYENIVSLIKK